MTPIPRPDLELVATLPDGCGPVTGLCPTEDGRLMVSAGQRAFLVSLDGDVREIPPAFYEAGNA